MATTISPKLFLDNYGIFINMIYDGLTLYNISGNKTKTTYTKDYYKFILTFKKLSTCENCNYKGLILHIEKLLLETKTMSSEFDDYFYTLYGKIDEVIDNRKVDSIIIVVNGIAKLTKKEK